LTVGGSRRRTRVVQEAINELVDVLVRRPRILCRSLGGILRKVPLMLSLSFKGFGRQFGVTGLPENRLDFARDGVDRDLILFQLGSDRRRDTGCRRGRAGSRGAHGFP